MNNKKEIISGTEPFSSLGTKDIGILMIHGYTRSPGSIRYAAIMFAKEGFHIEMPLLSGHGTRYEDMIEIKSADWIHDADQAYQTLKKRVKYIFVFGFSMGGSLALILANRYPEIKGLILLNHPVMYRSIKVLLVPFLKNIIRTVKGVGSDIKNPKEHEISYEIQPVKASEQFFKTVYHAKRLLKTIKQPSLILKSKEDHVVEIYNAVYTYNKIKSKTKNLVWLENSYHVACQDYDRDIIVEQTLNFIKQISETEEK